MEDLIVCLLEIFLEIVANVPLSAVETSENSDKSWSVIGTCVMFACLGGLIAYLSLLIWPMSFLHSPVLRLFHVLLSPLFAAYLAYRLGQTLFKLTELSQLRLRAWRTYCFTLSLVLVRYTFAKLI